MLAVTWRNKVDNCTVKTLYMKTEETRTSTKIPVRLCFHSFCSQWQILTYRSTGSAAYVLPRTRTRFGKCGFFYSGSAAWNTLPTMLLNLERRRRKVGVVTRRQLKRSSLWLKWGRQIFSRKNRETPSVAARRVTNPSDATGDKD